MDYSLVFCVREISKEFACAFFKMTYPPTVPIWPKKMGGGGGQESDFYNVSLFLQKYVCSNV